MQTSYSIDQAAGRVGGIADSSMVQDIETYKAVSAPVYVGRVVTMDGAEGIKHPTALAQVTDEKLVKGVVVASHEMESNNIGSEPVLVQGSVVPVMRKGRLWVQPTDAITHGISTVNVDVTTNFGKLSGAALASSASAVLPKAKFKTSTSSGNQLAILEIDL